MLEILVVEGQEAQQELIRTCLAVRGRERIQIEFASTVKDAVATLTLKKFNCILLSDRLPDGRGLDVLEEMDDQLLTSPVIGLSSENDPAVAIEYFRAGCVDFFIARDVLDTGKLRRSIARAMARFHRRAMGTVIERRQLGDAVIKAQEGLIALARIDRLTGLCNRAVFDDYFSQHHAEALGRQGQYAICMIDVDRFKLYNDHYGHQAGDEALKIVAQALTSTLRETDFIARYGGEEIVVLLDEINEENSWSVGDRLRGLVQNKNVAHEHNKPYGFVTVSIGIAVFDPESGETTSEILSRADAALYQAKDDGRNRVVIAKGDSADRRLSA